VKIWNFYAFLDPCRYFFFLILSTFLKTYKNKNNKVCLVIGQKSSEKKLLILHFFLEVFLNCIYISLLLVAQYSSAPAHVLLISHISYLISHISYLSTTGGPGQLCSIPCPPHAVTTVEPDICPGMSSPTASRPNTS